MGGLLGWAAHISPEKGWKMFLSLSSHPISEKFGGSLFFFPPLPCCIAAVAIYRRRRRRWSTMASTSSSSSFPYFPYPFLFSFLGHYPPSAEEEYMEWQGGISPKNYFQHTRHASCRLFFQNQDFCLKNLAKLSPRISLPPLLATHH